MAINALVSELEITVDQRLQQFTYPQLLAVVDVLTKRMRIRDLAQLLADQQHFTIKNLFRAIERFEDGTLLVQFLNDPTTEQELHQSIERWVLDQGLHLSTLKANEQISTLLGWKEIGYRGRSITRLWENQELWVIEATIKRSLNDIDHAYSHAEEMTRGAHYCFVTISPYVWYKYPDRIRKKIDSISNIGVLLVDRSRVIKTLADAKLNDVEKNRYNALKSMLE